MRYSFWHMYVGPIINIENLCFSVKLWQIVFLRFLKLFFRLMGMPLSYVRFEAINDFQFDVETKQKIIFKSKNNNLLFSLNTPVPCSSSSKALRYHSPETSPPPPSRSPLPWRVRARLHCATKSEIYVVYIIDQFVQIWFFCLICFCSIIWVYSCGILRKKNNFLYYSSVITWHYRLYYDQSVSLDSKI